MAGTAILDTRSTLNGGDYGFMVFVFFLEGQRYNIEVGSIRGCGI